MFILNNTNLTIVVINDICYTKKTNFSNYKETSNSSTTHLYTKPNLSSFDTSAVVELITYIKV